MLPPSGPHQLYRCFVFEAGFRNLMDGCDKLQPTRLAAMGFRCTGGRTCFLNFQGIRKGRNVATGEVELIHLFFVLGVCVCARRFLSALVTAEAVSGLQISFSQIQLYSNFVPQTYAV